MSASKPSREVPVVDVPDVDSFTARFAYSYHVPDEGSNASAGVPHSLLSRPGEFFDARTIDYLAAGRTPRRVVFTWKPVTYRDRVYGQSAYENEPVPKGYIKANLSKILSEEHFGADQFTSLNISDQSIDRKLYSYISASATVLNSQRQNANTQRGLALQTDAITSNEVDFEFLTRYLVQPSEDGVFFYERDSQRIRNELVNKLKGFNMQVQLNNSVIHTLFKRSASSPESTFEGAHLGMYEISRKIQGRSQTRGLRELKADDYRTVAPEYTSLVPMRSTDPSLSSRARVVGYIVDKFELTANGDVVRSTPIIVENANASSTVDLQVKYYSRYQYAIRTIAELSVPAVVEDTGELVLSRFLIASRPSSPQLVSCVETVPPPPPSDIRFTWDRTSNNLFMSWAFPPNPQRDVKQFQVFRRRSTAEAFELVKQFSFDDSTVAGPYAEYPDPRLVERVLNPKLGWVDSEFTRESSFIYTVACVDAHGMVSAYGPQSQVTFSSRKNRLEVRRVSPAGAPRPYPNLLVDSNAFVDSVIESKKHVMRVAFVPEHDRVVDKNFNDLGFLKTAESGGVYKILALNTDLTVAQTVDIVIKDKRPVSESLKPAETPATPDYGDSFARRNTK